MENPDDDKDGPVLVVNQLWQYQFPKPPPKFNNSSHHRTRNEEGIHDSLSCKMKQSAISHDDENTQRMFHTTEFFQGLNYAWALIPKMSPHEKKFTWRVRSVSHFPKFQKVTSTNSPGRRVVWMYQDSNRMRSIILKIMAINQQI